MIAPGRSDPNRWAILPEMLAQKGRADAGARRDQHGQIGAFACATGHARRRGGAEDHARHQDLWPAAPGGRRELVRDHFARARHGGDDRAGPGAPPARDPSAVGGSRREGQRGDSCRTAEAGGRAERGGPQQRGGPHSESGGRVAGRTGPHDGVDPAHDGERGRVRGTCDRSAEDPSDQLLAAHGRSLPPVVPGKPSLGCPCGSFDPRRPGNG